MFYRTLCCCLALVGNVSSLRAEVEDAYSKALELATGPYKQGVKIREDHWKGSLTSGEKKGVKVQLFKGNEYWLWLGTEVNEVTMSLDIYQASGEKITVETVSKPGATGIHFTAPMTGTYVAIFTASLKSGEGAFQWALAMGYR